MPNIYGDKRLSLKHAKLSVGTLASIGCLVRAIATLDDVLTLYIAKLADLNEGPTIRLLGRSAISTKVGTALYFAKLRGLDETTRFKSVFDAQFDEYIDCRNAVSHGIFLGKTEENRYAFVVYSPLDPVNGNFTTEAVTYTAKDIRIYSEEAEALSILAAEKLGVRASQEIRLQQSLDPHRKSLKSELKTPQSQPQSSPAKGPKPSARQLRDARELAALRKLHGERKR